MKRPIKKTVYSILEKDKYARQDDNYLIMRVVQRLEPNLSGTTFVEVMQNLTYKGISLEGITRARRSFFTEYPELRVITTEQARREKEQEYYLEYSRRY